jgi:hypothetical protein
MISWEIAATVFGCVFGGALLGMLLRGIVPQYHFSEDSKEVIKLGMGLIATMAALVLGLVIATAKNSYDAQHEAVTHTAAKILLLERLLAHYGPETKEARDLLRRIVAERTDAIWPEDRSKRASLDTPEVVLASRELEVRILQLAPRSDSQRWLQSRALKISGEIMETRWLVLGGLGSSVPVPFLAVVVFWLTIIFGSFGLLAPRNLTVVVVLFLCALSVAGSIFLILEMDRPFEGLMKVSSAPMHYALSHLGQ